MVLVLFVSALSICHRHRVVSGILVAEWDVGCGRAEWIHIGNNHVAYVSDAIGDRVRMFNLEGTFIGQWGALGDQDGEFNTPSGIVTDPYRSEVFIADHKNNRIQVFQSLTETESTLEFKSPNGETGNSGGNAGGNVGTFLRKIDNVCFPLGLALDHHEGQLFVSSEGPPCEKGQIYIFSTTNGAQLRCFSFGGSPHGLAFDPLRREVIVANGMNLSAFAVSSQSVSMGCLPEWRTIGNAGIWWLVHVDFNCDQIFVTDSPVGRVVVCNREGVATRDWQPRSYREQGCRGSAQKTRDQYCRALAPNYLRPAPGNADREQTLKGISVKNGRVYVVASPRSTSSTNARVLVFE